MLSFEYPEKAKAKTMDALFLNTYKLSKTLANYSTRVYVYAILLLTFSFIYELEYLLYSFYIIGKICIRFLLISSSLLKTVRYCSMDICCFLCRSYYGRFNILFIVFSFISMLLYWMHSILFVTICILEVFNCLGDWKLIERLIKKVKQVRKWRTSNM